jgi:hypothetical protein
MIIGERASGKDCFIERTAAEVERSNARVEWHRTGIVIEPLPSPAPDTISMEVVCEAPSCYSSIQ